MPTESVRLCLMKDHNFLLPFLLRSSWFGMITDSTCPIGCSGFFPYSAFQGL